MEAITTALNQQAANARWEQENATRRSQMGSGMRGDKRRTYRFQDNEVVDHVTGKRARCSDIMRGGFERLWK
jgi:protein subunit release factor A